MKVLLAGYNLDTEVIEGLKRGDTARQDITPETLSASYARISRDPRPIDELRAAARGEVEKARKSNSNIIFKMGHHSVAEHAVFNFDVIGVSRFALEELEKFRLCSYTEKSQRYQTLEGNDFIPDEIANSDHKKQFRETNSELTELYQKMVAGGIEPEDARYITPLSTPAQVGLTINARNLELLFRRFASSPLIEVRTLGRLMYEKVKPIAPSIILFTEANKLDRDTYPELKKAVEGSRGIKKGKMEKECKEVKLVEHTKDADLNVLAALIHTSSELGYEECMKAAKDMGEKEKKELFKTALKNLEFYDAAIREFEFADLTYELTVSAACFGQLKRHRIATLTCQDYSPELGIKVPPAVEKSKFGKDFSHLADKAGLTFHKIARDLPSAAPYILTNAHRKRVLFKLNARELYHISRLREDAHAQWDIQKITEQMTKLAKRVMPLTLMTIGGKDAYPEVYKRAFGKLPKLLPL